MLFLETFREKIRGCPFYVYLAACTVRSLYRRVHARSKIIKIERRLVFAVLGMGSTPTPPPPPPPRQYARRKRKYIFCNSSPLEDWGEEQIQTTAKKVRSSLCIILPCMH